ncbi:MAG: tetratricopeptide repeat protein [Ruminococcaceae bacterium]|nr:tetratricopeptide repeat protein [Oscillospiraceae bacterium]
MMKKTKNKLSLILVGVVLILAVLLALFLPSLSKRMEIDRQFEIAQQYLNDLDYESAMLAFNKILEIDPNNVAVYRGMAEAYIGMGDRNAAFAILEEGIALTGSEELAAYLEQLRAEDEEAAPAEIVFQNEELDTAIRTFLGIDGQAPITGALLETVNRFSITPTTLEIEKDFERQPVLESPDMISLLASDPGFIEFVNACPDGYGYVFIDLYGYEGTAPDLSPFAKLLRLSELNLYDIQFPNLEFLRLFPDITYLNLVLDGYDLEPLRDLKMEWGQLTVTANEQKTLDAFLAIAKDYTNLSSLWIYSRYADDISGISALSDHKDLWQLSLHMDVLADVSPVASLPQLTYFGLFSIECESIAPLSTLVNLEYLDLRGYSSFDDKPYNGVPDGKLSDISAIAYMPKLRSINIQECAVTDVSVINGLQELRGLDLPECMISDISMLTDLPNVKTIRLDRNKSIRDISVVANYPNLEGLDITENLITDISAVSNLTNLRYFYFSENPISDLTPLSGFSPDVQMDAHDCPIKDWSPVAHIDYVYGRPE